MKKKLLILSFIFCTLPVLLYCQNNPEAEAEKLKIKLLKVGGTEKARTLLSLSYIYNTLSTDSAFHYAQMALKFAKILKNDTLIGRSLLYIGQAHLLSGNDSLCISAFSESAEIFKKNNDSLNLANVLTAIGQYYYYKAEYDNSYRAYNKALVIYSKLNDPKSYDNVILVLNGISFIYFERKDYKNTLFYMHRALKIADALNDNGYTVATLYSSMGSVYYDWKQYDKALEYYRKAFEINKSNGNSSLLGYSLNEVGKTYLIMGHSDTAYYYFSEAAIIFSEVKDDLGISVSDQYMGDIYQEKQKFEIALRYYKTALSICEKKDEQARMSSILFEIGKTYYKMKLMDRALENSNRSLNIALKVGFTDYIYKDYELLSDIYTAMDSCGNAFFFYKKFITKRDSIFNKDIHQQISDIQG
ncbi:MAG: tetratricopeptide repeat protein, partial [Bacteroidota bacterium]